MAETKEKVKAEIREVEGEIEQVREKVSDVSDNGQKGRLEIKLDNLLEQLHKLESRLEKLESKNPPEKIGETPDLVSDEIEPNENESEGDLIDELGKLI